jgi:hypothetical protein
LRQRLFECLHHRGIIANPHSAAMVLRPRRDHRYGSGCARCCLTQSRTASSSGVDGAL